jgi:dTDP-4-amino-4,6-dideoxygalactose transaminase
MRSLPPVRRPVPLSRGDPVKLHAAMRSFFENREVVLFASGTTALSAAIAEARACRAVTNPEVILPAYGCPDLVAACMHASVSPRLVDTMQGAWGYEPESLRDALSTRTVAIVAVNLMGIGDDSAALARQASIAGISLIQDSAQCLPRAERHWPGEFVVLSFGRGKPLNLLRGGALVLPHDHQLTTPSPGNEKLHGRARLREILLSTRLAALAFNVATQPAVFWWVSRLLGAKLGETRFRALEHATRMPPRSWRQVGRAFELYRHRPYYSMVPWSAAMKEWEYHGITPLPAADGQLETELLRLPLLASTRAARDSLVAALNRHGLGASILYGTPLNRAEDIPASVAAQGPFPNAEALANRLFTLPTHSAVTRRIVELTRSVVSKWAREN